MPASPATSWHHSLGCVGRQQKLEDEDEDGKDDKDKPNEDSSDDNDDDDS